MSDSYRTRPQPGVCTLTFTPAGTGARQGNTLLRTAVLAAILLHAPPGYAQNFTPPDLAGYTQHSERDADGDGDGVSETHIVQYANTHADSLFSMTTKGRTWAWSLDTRGTDSGPENYVIRDSDCDGTFDEVYGLDEEFHVPDCLK